MAPPSSPPSSGDEEKDSLLPPEAPPRSAAAAAAAAGSWRFAKIWTTSKLVYAAPAFATSGQALFNYIFTTKFYLDDMKLPPVRFALVSSVVRSLDLLLYPMMGYLLDNVRLKMGRRRPYFIFMAPLVGLTYFAMYSPPAGWGVDGVSVWFCVTFFANGFLPLTLPYMALGAEVTMDEGQRTSLYSYRHIAADTGRAFSVILPSILIASGWHGDHKGTCRVFAATSAVLMVLFFWNLAMRVRIADSEEEHSRRAAEKPWLLWEYPAPRDAEAYPFLPGLRKAFGNRPFIYILFAYVWGSSGRWGWGRRRAIRAGVGCGGWMRWWMRWWMRCGCGGEREEG
jgi:Na+/melibiose symporter-like transporter